MWLDNVVMLACGWIGGAASALLILRALDGRKPEPLDPALLPKWEPRIPPAATYPSAPEPLPFSPYAPKPRRASPHTDRITKVWRAAKQERPTSWTSASTSSAAPSTPSPAPRPPEPKPVTDLLPAIPWGQNKPPA